MKDIIFDYSKLRGKIKECLGSEKVFAERMSMSQQALSARLNNKTEFADNEIYRGKQILSLTTDEVGIYFFTPKVQKREQIATGVA